MVEVVLVECGHCGAPNHPARTKCGRCRLAMDKAAPEPDQTEVVEGLARSLPPEDDTPPVPARQPTGARVVDLLRGTAPGDTQPLDPVPPAEIEPLSIGTRSVVAITLAGLGLGAAVGIIVATGLGGGGGDAAPAVAPVVFDEATYTGEADRLEVVEVRASTTLSPTGDNRYEAVLVLDEDRTTAWNSDGASVPDGVGEVLSLRLAEPAWVTSLEFANGYQKDDVRFLANARIARAALTFDDGSRVNVVLLDQTGFQRVPLPAPRLTTSVVVEVLEVFEGDTYDDLAVSELRVFGHVAVGADRDRALRTAAGADDA